MALRSLRVNLFRTFLTLLGIIIGVGAVVAMLAIGSGSKREVLSRIEAMGTDLLVIRPGGRNIRTPGDNASLVPDDALAVGEMPNVAHAVPDLIKKLTDFLKDGILPRYFGVTVPDSAAIYLIAAGIVVATAVNSFSASTAEINLATAGRTLGFNLRGALFAHLQRLPLAFHLRRSTGDVLTRITGDVKAMEARLKYLRSSAALSEINFTARRSRILGPIGYVGYGAWWVVSKLFVIR